MPQASALLERLKQRKLGQWSLAYLAGAWLLLQVLSLLAQPFGWPDDVVRIGAVVAAIGFLVVLVLAWYHGERGAQRVTGMELLMLTALLVLTGAAVSLVHARMRPATSAGRVSAEAVTQGSIAVLPFANVSADREQKYFADGLTDELLSVLGQIPELHVAARTSSFALAGKQLPADSIARALHVATLLEGSVRKDGMQVRINAELVDAKSGFAIWQGTFDRDLKDVFQVQDDISHAIVSALRVKLAGGRDTAALIREETRDAKAHLYVLEGLHLVTLRTMAELSQAEGLFKEAIQRDPRYARAYAGLASVHWLQGYYRFKAPALAYGSARTEAEQALRLDSTTAEAHVVLGRIADIHDWDFGRAEREFRRAVELNPSLSDAYALHAWLLMRLGRRQESLADALHATELDPLSPSAVNTLAVMYMYAGDAARCIDLTREAIALAPRAAVLRANLAEALSYAGRHAEALVTADSLLALAPDDALAKPVVAYVYARAGRRARGEQLLREAEQRPETSPYMLAVVNAGLGDRARLLTYLEEAVRRHDDFVSDLGVDPVLADYRSDPRVEALIARIGLPH